MGETTMTTSTVSTVASSSGTAAATVGSTDMYAAIPTLPIAAALAAAGSETAELNGGSCGLLDRPDKKQVHSIVLIVYIVLREMTFIASCISRDELRCFDGKDRVCRSFKPLRE
jgi:hypothetical protein